MMTLLSSVTGALGATVDRLFFSTDGCYDALKNLKKKVENVKLVDRLGARKPSAGTLYITTTHLIFVDADRAHETWILHMHIESLERLQMTTIGSPLYIQCKTFQCVTLIVPRERDCQDVYTTLQELSRPMNLDELHAFYYSPSADTLVQGTGWTLYDAEREYERMQAISSGGWCTSNINATYELCDTYPKCIVVPRGATTPMLVASSMFRSRGRLPVLCYYHKETQATITRCSQPLSGFSARCQEDEQLLNLIRQQNPTSAFLYVVDTRPKINALANKVAGKGYENESFYSDIKFVFLGIGNLHVMRSSLRKLVEVCELREPSVEEFLSGLMNSAWLKHIKSILDTSLFISQAVGEEGTSVLVHCSDGWDRTAQTCSLASILLDPFYRTVPGFLILVEKEWLSFGHKFTDRCGHLQSDQKEKSPIFTQFIDATWQVLQQFPCAFQFNDKFLLALHDHAYSCQFGTFIGNCEKDRVDLRLSDRTYSLWGYLLHNLGEFVNPLYRREDSQMGVLKPNTSPQNVRFWKGMYMRFESWIHPKESAMDSLCVLKDQSCSLEDHLKLVSKRISSMKVLVGKNTEQTATTLPRSCMTDSAISSVSGLSDDTVSTDVATTPTCILTPLLPGATREGATVSECESGVDVGCLQVSLSTVESCGGCAEGSGNAEAILAELESVSVEWRSLRKARTCPCAAHFEHFTRKYHCWRCGRIYCSRCIDKRLHLLGHFSNRAVPVCRNCYKQAQSTL